MSLAKIEWGALINAALSGQAGRVLARAFPEMVAGVMGGQGVAYVATPYSRVAVDRDGLWSFEGSLRCARLASAELNALRIAGVSAISPIVMAHGMIESAGQFQGVGHSGGVQFVPRIDPLDDAMWMRWCMPLISAATCIVVPDLPGWDRSVGIEAEARAAINLGKPVFLYAGARDGGGV